MYFCTLYLSEILLFVLSQILCKTDEFLASLVTDLEIRVLFLHIIYLPLWYKFMLKSPRMQVSLLVVSSFAKFSWRVLMKLV